jgi:transcriptional regulator with XRE-family HTH domain
MSDFGDSVRWRRKAVGMRQGELAAKIRRNHRATTASYISRIESGEIDPRLSTVNSIARALKVKPWQLVAGFEQPFWDDYLQLSPIGKREVQRMIDWRLERRG